eukprot:7038745-Pyramimonas_sp.AAC.2
MDADTLPWAPGEPWVAGSAEAERTMAEIPSDMPYAAVPQVERTGRLSYTIKDDNDSAVEVLLHGKAFKVKKNQGMKVKGHEWFFSWAKMGGIEKAWTACSNAVDWWVQDWWPDQEGSP